LEKTYGYYQIQLDAQTAEEAIRMAFLGHELACQIGQEDNFFVKLEVISDPKYLLPDPWNIKSS
jgi:thiazole synthase ThiGH ThiG subunit